MAVFWDALRDAKGTKCSCRYVIDSCHSSALTEELWGSTLSPVDLLLMCVVNTHGRGLKFPNENKRETEEKQNKRARWTSSENLVWIWMQSGRSFTAFSGKLWITSIKKLIYLFLEAQQRLLMIPQIRAELFGVSFYRNIISLCVYLSSVRQIWGQVTGANCWVLTLICVCVCCAWVWCLWRFDQYSNWILANRLIEGGRKERQ